MSAHRIPADLRLSEFKCFPDPGTGNPLPHTIWGEIAINVAAGVAETNTLPDPERAGMDLVLVVYSLGAAGTRAITAATKIDTTPHTTITFNAVDQAVFLKSISYSGNNNKARWEVVVNDGATLS